MLSNLIYIVLLCIIERELGRDQGREGDVFSAGRGIIEKKEGVIQVRDVTPVSEKDRLFQLQRFNHLIK